MRSALRTWMCLILIGLVSPVTSLAEDTSIEELKTELRTLKGLVQELSSTVKAQQGKIAELTSGKTEQAKEVSAQTAATPISPAASISSLKPYLPEIGLVGDIVGQLTESDEDEEGNDKISVREIELVFGHDVDPYTRFDATLTWSDLEDPEIEEAYATFLDLPAHTLLHLGRMRPRVGIASAMHRDSLDTVDEPLVVSEMFGVEGFYKTGIELSNYLPSLSERITHEVIVGLLEGGAGEDGNLFGETRRAPTIYGRLRNSCDISYDSLLNVGGTFLAGSTDEDYPFETRAYGADAVFKHKLDAIKRIKFQSEAYFRTEGRRATLPEEESADEESEEESVLLRDNPWGAYFLTDFRFAERWAVGGRFDLLKPLSFRPEQDQNNDYGYSAYVTFFQSEFARWRFQYEYLDLADGDDERFFLQSTFALGTHKHKLQ